MTPASTSGGSITARVPRPRAGDAGDDAAGRSRKPSAASSAQAENGSGNERPPGGSAKPTDKKKKPDLSSVWREARWIIWRSRGRLAIGLVLIVIGRLAGLVLPATSKFLVDDVLAGGRAELLLPLAAAAGAATIVQAASGFTLAQILSVTAQRAITEMRKDVEQHVLRLPVSYFDSTKSGILISRIMTDAEGIRNLVGTGLVQLVGGVLTAAASLAVLFYLNWQMTVVTLVLLLGFGSMMAIAFRYLRPLFRERGELNAQVTGRLTESLGGVRVIKSYTAEKREDLIFAKGAHALFRNVAKTIFATSSVSAGASLMFGAISVVMMVMGGRAVLSETMTLGDVVSYVFFTAMVAAPLIQISSIGTQISEAFAGLDRIHEVRAHATEDVLHASREPLDEIRGDIEFRDVSFEYEAGRPVLHRISFTAAAGTTTALVGSSGSGKSTTIGLVAGFHRPTQGTLFVDGRSLDDVRLRDYRRHIGIVLQDNFLFDGTVADNIAYGNPTASREDILEAGRIAHVEAFVNDFPDGYDTVVGERGVKVSGGQRQRIAIARAVLAEPTILILDEATSSLDSESEALIQDGLERLRRGRTTFVIAHRLSTIRSADQILVMENGEIVERGTHQELFDLGGRYRELHDRQMSWERNRFVNPGEELGELAAQDEGSTTAARG